jgi:acetaldehyde dehydrogenase (acetylating)
MIKLLRSSELLELAALVGIDPESDGLARAARWASRRRHAGIDGLQSPARLARYRHRLRRDLGLCA